MFRIAATPIPQRPNVDSGLYWMNDYHTLPSLTLDCEMSMWIFCGNWEQSLCLAARHGCLLTRVDAKVCPSPCVLWHRKCTVVFMWGQILSRVQVSQLLRILFVEWWTWPLGCLSRILTTGLVLFHRQSCLMMVHSCCLQPDAWLIWKWFSDCMNYMKELCSRISVWQWLRLLAFKRLGSFDIDRVLHGNRFLISSYCKLVDAEKLGLTGLVGGDVFQSWKRMCGTCDTGR